MMLSAGYCPVCSITGVLVFLVAEHDHRVFIACNMCKAAWKVPAPVQGWDHDLQEFAPHGFRAATLREVAASGQDTGQVEEISDEEFDLFKS